MSGLGLAAVAITMAIGLAGVILPGVPALVLVWAAALAYGLFEGFDPVGWTLFGFISVLFVGGTLAKFVLSSRGGTGRGASRLTLLIGLVAGVIGLFVVPVVGMPLFAVAGILLAERQRTDDWTLAWHRTKGVLLGFGLGTALEFAAGLLMVALWVGWVLARSATPI